MSAGCLDASELAQLADGSIDSDARARVLPHLSECARCRRASAELVRGQSGMDAEGGANGRGPSAVDAEGDAIGRYILGEPIGAGAMGVVFRAHDPLLDRAIAIKLVDGQGLDDAARTRLLEEAKAMARVTAPGVVACYDAGYADGDVFVAMELVEGATLRAWAATPRPWREVLATLLPVARGLAIAHAAGLVHRDVKPDNILVRTDGRAAIGDFGLARAAGGIVDRGIAGVTRAAGTPGYLAPEVRSGKTAAAPADQYAFCLTLIEAIRGGSALAGSTALADARILAEETPRDDHPRSVTLGGGIPPRIARVLRRGLANDPEQRFPSMTALADALERAARPPWRRIVIAALASVAVAAVAWRLLAPSSETCTAPDLEATLYTPVAHGVLAAMLSPDELARTDRLVRDQLAVHRTVWGTCPAPPVRACLDDAEDTLATYLSAFRTSPALAHHLAGRRFDLLRVEECRPGMTATLAKPGSDLAVSVRRSMQLAHALIDAGELDAARSVLTNLAWSDALGDRALTADILMLRGIIDAWLEAPTALDELASARRIAATSGDGVRRVRLLLNLGQFYAAQRNDVVVAKSLLDEAAPLVASLGNRLLVADLAYQQALLELAANRLPAASVAIQRAYEATVDVFGENRPELGQILIVRGQIASLAQDPAPAVRDYTRVVALYTDAYGAMHDETLNARINLATHALLVKDIERGKAELRAVIAALEASGDQSLLADATSGLCEALYNARDADGIASCRHALQTAERGYGDTHPRFGVALFDLGHALVDDGDDAHLPEAITLLRRAEPLLAPMGDDMLATCRFLLARALVAANQDAADAHRLLDLAIPVLRHNTTRAPLVEMVPQWYAPWRTLAAFAGAR